MVSIVVPILNGEPYLRECLDSVQRQTFSDWEMIWVVDPKSQDRTWNLANGFVRDEPRLKLEWGRKTGAAAGRNQALKRASGDYVAFHDVDDLWDPEKLSRQLELMHRTGAALTCTGFRRFRDSDHKRIVGRIISPPQKITYARLLQQNCMLCSSVMVRRESLSHTHFPDMGCEDFAGWLDVMAHDGPALSLPEPLVFYRIHSDSRGASKFKSFTETWAIYRRHLGLNRTFSTILMVSLTARCLLKYSRF